MVLIQGKLFEGIPVISTDPRKMFHYFCQLMYLHFARSSVIKERLPGVIKTIAKHKVTEVVCFHDECYGTFTSYCPAVNIDVPFKPIHLFEYLYNRLNDLKGEIRPVKLKVAYQRPCSSRLSPDKYHFVQDIFDLIGAESVQRNYVGENALCCGGTIEGQRREGSRKRAADVQKRNIEDMKNAGAEVCVFNCPACYQTLGERVARNGIRPIFMSDLCRLAIGEKPAGWR
jgi:Fe-S oxidoreductase